MLNRRNIITAAATAPIALAVFAAQKSGAQKQAPQSLAPPRGRAIRVGFIVGTWANLMDVAGPWETFASVAIAGGSDFDLYTVAARDEIIRMTAGMQIKPHYTIENAPQPDIIVSPAHGATDASIEWLRQASKETDVTMSVCTGAFPLARAGLLSGLEAATHHDFWDRFEDQHPNVTLIKGLRYVDNGRIASAGGLTSGIDLALHIVDRYFGRDVAAKTAEYLEYQSTGWIEG